MVVPDGRNSHILAKKRQIRDYGIAILAVLLAWVIRIALAPLLGGHAPLLVFALAVSLAAYSGGLGPGLLATAVSTLIGTYFFVQEPTLGQATSVLLYIAVCIAISVVCSQLRRALRNVAQSEERFRLLVDGAPETAIFALDAKGRVVSWNVGAKRLYGYDSPEAIGRNISFVFPDEDRENGEPEKALVEAYQVGSFRSEGWRVRKDGSQFWAEAVLTALRDSSGTLTGFSKITRDLTDAKAVENALRASEETTRALMESAAQGIIGVDRDGRIVLTNAMAERLFGYSRQELIGRPIEILLPVELRDRHTAHRQEYSSNPHDRPMGLGMALSARRKDGSQFPVEISLSTVQTRSGQVSVSFITDISSRRAAEQERENLIRELAEERSRLRAVLDQMPVGVVIVEATRLQIVLHNQEAERLLKHEVIVPRLLDTPFGPEHPDGRPMSLEELPVMHALRHGTITQQVEVRYRRGPNDVTVFSHSAAPIRDSQGSIVAAVATFTDISAQKRAELEREGLLREIAESRALLDSVFDNAPIGLAVYDKDLKFIRLNDALAEINGIDKDAHVGRSVPELLPDIPGNVGEAFRFVFERGEPLLNLEVAGMTPAAPGKLRQWATSFFPVKSDGDILYCGIVVDEITSQKDSERALRALNRSLERANEDLRQFAYAASHDLQEPLRMVTSYTQLLERRYGGHFDDTARQYMQYAITGALRIEDLLRGLREYWQVSEVTDRAPVWTDCNAVLDRALQNLESAVRETDALVTRDSLPVVLADETPLLQLFQNLISNAVKYRRPDRRPRVHINAVLLEGEWMFSVSDNGIGIDPQYARQIFGIFKRLNGYRYSGAGMGLAICQKIVERFGGRIWVESELDVGADFRFTIPVGEAPIRDGVDSNGITAQISYDSTSPAPAAGSHR